MSKKIKIIDNIYRKTPIVNSLQIEAEKTKRAAHIGQNSGIFYVPRILRISEKDNIIDFEYIANLCTLQHLVVSGNPQLTDILIRTGEALAVIHKELILPGNMKKNLPDIWIRNEADNVFIHGDFTLHNVCFHKTTNSIVILDWSTARFIDAEATFGSRYFDIIWFIYHIFHFFPMSNILKWNADKMANAFLRGYIKKNNCLHKDRFKYYQLELEKIKRPKFLLEAQTQPIYTRGLYFLLWLWKRYRYNRYKPLEVF